VVALAASGGNVYAAGSFTSLNGIPAGRIARWNGNGWVTLGSGLNGTVRALAVVGNDLFAGGDFTMAGGVGANRVAKWDGSNWSALGLGVGASADYALALVGKPWPNWAHGRPC